MDAGASQPTAKSTSQPTSQPIAASLPAPLDAPAARRAKRAPWALFGICALLALWVLSPLVYTVLRAGEFSLDDIRDLVWRPLVGELLWNTVLIVVSATAASAVIGTAAAWFVERTRLPGRRMWAVLVAIPLAVPAFISSYAWVSLSLDLQDFAGALIVITCSYYPLVYLPVAAALRGMDPSLEESARALGCGPWVVFARVIVPQLRPALFGGMLLVALGVLSEFGAFTLLRFRTFTTEIYAEYRTTFDGAGAAVFACVLIVLCLILIGLEFRVRGAARYETTGRGARRLPVIYALGWRVVPVLTGFVALAVATLGVPIGMIVFWLTQPGAEALTPAEVSFDRVFDATLASLGLGASAAVVATVIALPLGVLLVRYPGRWATLFERIVYLMQGIPGIVIALAVVSLAVRALRPLYQSWELLVLTYALMFLPFALVNVRAALVQAQPRLEETARSLGLGWFAAVWRVMVPLAGPGLGAAAAMVFTTVITELTTTLLLVPIGTHTLATEVWADTSTLAFAAAAPYAALLVGLSLAATWMLIVLFGRSAVLGKDA
ncbi:ABC transporter permease [Pararobbsia silviterrae]|uniref:Iron ABC transporter permease n=1 Tax=Pararobbsia silviterrae TaxID=1792498 RepID=A0A494XJ41_9BURK|nr:iron ABC transporter permease [Pararobbsia silviterrae]RKP49731.1 iron ABC transporter permease [Pararobbsia silviterrae]